MRLAFSTTFLSSALALLLASTAVSAAPQTYLTVYGEPAKYPAGFTHFDYANPNAPKGGSLLPFVIHMSGLLYLACALGLGARFLHWAWMPICVSGSSTSQ